MPFLGRDWRSPGDQWVRTSEGWERLKLWRVKLFDNLNENFLARLVRLALTDLSAFRDDQQKNHQPHIHFIKRNSRERKINTSVNEAFIRLDISGAVKDVRRFNYVCKLMELLIKKLTSLSGTTQKYIFHSLEEILTQVLKSQYNLEVIRQLLRFSVKALNDGVYYHIGSQALWGQHKQSVNRMMSRLEDFHIKEREDDEKLKFADLPEDCIRDILLRLYDHKDIIRTGLTNSAIYELSQENVLWKQLSFYHFDNKQLMVFIPRDLQENEIDWKAVYKRCVKRFGAKDTFADMLAICSHCDRIFWRMMGHPCMKEEKTVVQLLTPEAFINLFSL